MLKKIDKSVIILLFLFLIISVISIYSASSFLDTKNLYIKQIIWYLIGFGITGIILKIGNDFIFKYAYHLYILGNISLLLVLFFGKNINNATCWFEIPYIGTIQPSEFMKIILIIVLAKMMNEFNNNSIKDEFFFLIKVGIIVMIPSILTFLEPDTGVVLIYLLITICMLFIAGIRYRWFIILFTILAITLGSILVLYFFFENLFINILGDDFFLRINRLLDWQNKEGYQLEKGITAIASAGIFGHGFNNTPLYFPEPGTDFIFATFSSNFGLIGSLILFILLGIFDIKLILIALKTNSNMNKLIIAGTVGMLLYQQFQNIGMTYGIIPITGITLPFISYGGSSLLSYMIIIGIILNMKKKPKLSN